MNQPAIAGSTATGLMRRAVTWWLPQVKHALPPTIFFFVGFNLILWTKRLILQEHGIEFSGYFTALVAALLGLAGSLDRRSLWFGQRGCRATMTG